LSTEQAQQLRADLASYQERLTAHELAALSELVSDLDVNAHKIAEHGRRADGIVQGMLVHSRGAPGQREPAEINPLVAECVNLVYHGLRAQDTAFHMGLDTQYDPSLEAVDLVSQDMRRVLLNLINNACYAAYAKHTRLGENFAPAVCVRTAHLDDRIAIYIRDNGDGIPLEIRDKIFQPFFTTKPAGVGTGLGLSISHDIVVREHQGEIRVDTMVGEYTEFTITLPKQLG
jgi:signal transduction histidine kinase